jgi:Phage derived protein Gp49-like (DUF891)
MVGLPLFRNFDNMALALWTFRCYVSPSGRDVIDDWYRQQSDEVQTAFDVTREYLEQRIRNEWRRPDFDLLSGKLRGLGELRFKVDKQYRVFGFFGPRQADFTMLIGASKKAKNYDPRNALETALSRRAEVLADGRRCRVCNL